ncbi:ABC transporter ATP-binding protein [Actinomadura macrotermitis]|uniref:Glutathione import ATP-binding protein GsiA n=1 Tax=Actinomadura macrotermitis TaxID=2585200 RepID=A0A7K0BNC8_9ACTN|nr:ABC transporter ATP-binding protein [Actinomadura macrotermitis]MQY02685.1 Glutathione import ATP-binding protein GsiA [Actinomadura macrotermitis]
MIAVHGVTREYRRVTALKDVSLDVRPGERLGIVGESGSGKSTLARIMAGLDRPTAGTVTFDGRPLPEVDRRTLRSSVQFVFQDPLSSLDPRMRVADIVAEPLAALRLPGDRAARVAELLDAVGLPPDAAGRRPHQFSGGQRQRIAVARALAPRPRVLVADEPTSALDVSVRVKILDLLLDLAGRMELTLVLVSHDLAAVRYVSERVAVMRAGEIVEEGPDALTDPGHPYTRELLDAVPRLRR